MTRSPTLRWIAIVTVAEATGFALAATVALLVILSELDGGAAFALTVAGGCAEGALLGTGQWIAMPGHRPPRGLWIAATTAGAAIAWSLGMLPSTLGLRFDGIAIYVLTGLGGLALLASIPVLQWFATRRRGIIRWIPVNMGAWAVAVLWTVAPSPFIDERSPVVLVASLYVAAGLLMALTISALTARTATRVFPRE